MSDLEEGGAGVVAIKPKKPRAPRTSAREATPLRPTADFVCNSPKCRTKHGARVYELPVKATHCPMGHKRLVRLFNSIHVNTGARPDAFDGRATSSSFAKRLDSLVEDPVREVEAKRDELKKAALPYRHDGPPGRRWRNDNGMVRVVPANRFGAAVKEVYDKGTIETPYAPTLDEQARKETRLLRGRGESVPGIIADMATGGAPPTNVVARDDGKV